MPRRRRQHTWHILHAFQSARHFARIMCRFLLRTLLPQEQTSVITHNKYRLKQCRHARFITFCGLSIKKSLMSDTVVNAKKNAGYYAAGLVADDMVVGLGTGSTVLYAMEKLAERIKDGEINILGIPTSIQTAMRAKKLGIPLTTLDEYPDVDIAIDGADQVDPAFNLIKGRGAAQTRERCLAECANQFIVVVDGSKITEKLSGIVPVGFSVSKHILLYKTRNGFNVILFRIHLLMKHTMLPHSDIWNVLFCFSLF